MQNLISSQTILKRTLNDYGSTSLNKIFRPQHNLKYLRTFETEQKRDRPPSTEFITATNIILKAINKFAPPELADRIINGYRRSDGSDIAAEANFLKADEPFFPLKKDEHYFRAIRVTRKLFEPKGKLRPVAYPDLRYYPWTLSTSAEAPFTFKAKWKTHAQEKHSQGFTDNGVPSFHNLYDEIFDKNRSIIHGIKHRSPQHFTEDGTPIPYYWHSLHTRAHLVLKTDDDKNRAVFGTPKLLLMAENMFIWPLMKTYLNNEINSPMLWGYETFKGGWHKLSTEIFTSTKPNSFLGIDWKGFDRKALFSIIDDVHDIWKSYFEFDKGYQPTNIYPETISQTNPEKIENLWKWMTYSIKHTPIRAASGNLYQFQYNGIASGYQQTQLLDSFVNCIMILTCLSSLGIDIESEDFYIKVQGDDSLVTFAERYFDIYGSYFLTMISKEAKSRFNADLSLDKSTFSNHLNDIEVLSYSNRYGMAYRDNAQLVAQLLYPERPRHKLAHTASAAIGIAMASMGTSKIIYNICFDIWNFIINTMNVQPKPLNLTRFIGPESTFIVTGDSFPTLEDIKDQQYFWNKDRTEAQRQSIWPTDQTKPFHFINVKT